MKYLVLLAVIAAVVWWALSRRPGQGKPNDSKAGKPAKQGAVHTQAMVSCAHCGVHLPGNETLSDATGNYCSESHRLAGPK
jgi:uncharacterized protein